MNIGLKFKKTNNAVRLVAFLVVMLQLSITALFAQETSQPSKIVVITKPIEPFVQGEANNLSGFSIDLWRIISQRIEVDTQFLYVESLGEMLDGIRNKEADAAIAALTITHAREEEMDFSHSYFQAGLQILVAKNRGSIAALVWATIYSVVSSSVFIVGLALFIAFVLIAAIGFWFAERHHNENISRKIHRGIWDSFWWSLVTVSTVGYGDMVPKTQIGRLLSIVWIIFGYIGFAWFTAVVTSTVTVSQLTGSINGPSDLVGKSVATLERSTSAIWMTKNLLGSRLIFYADINQAYRELEDGNIDAVIYDAPAVLYYAANEGIASVQTAGSIFHNEQYGIAFPIGSPLREQVNQALLEIIENGTHRQLMTKWFGVTQ